MYRSYMHITNFHNPRYKTIALPGRFPESGRGESRQVIGGGGNNKRSAALPGNLLPFPGHFAALLLCAYGVYS